MSRAAFLSKLRDVAPELLPYAFMCYGQPSTYCWWDNEGTATTCTKARAANKEMIGPLAPALYALGHRDALQRTVMALHPADSLR